MKYTSEFADINNKVYKVEITTESGSGTKNFTLAGNPLVTEMKSDGKNIYSPIKTVGATITMLTRESPFDIYSGKALGTKVVVTSDGSTVWTGYVTPCMYDMGFDDDLEELEIECVDGIAVLKDIPYRDSSHNVVTFGEIIFKCLKTSDCYKNFYITDNVQLTSNGTESIIEKFRISQLNFFDEKDDVNQSDDDVAWSCYDVLYELCQFLGYTLFADGDEVYIIDYDAIKAGNNKYFKYSLTGSSLGTPTSVNISYSYHIDGDSYSLNGTKISLDDVYNKVSVKDEFQTFDSIFPEFGDISSETNITSSYDSGLSTLVNNDSHYLLGDTFSEVNKNGDAENYQIFIAKNYKGRYFCVIIKFYSSLVFDFMKYSTSNRSDVSSLTKWSAMKYSDILGSHGAYYCRMFKKEISGSDYNNWRANYPSSWNSQTTDTKKAAWLKLLNSEPSKISLSPMVLCMNYSTGHIGPAAYNTTGKYDLTDNEDCRKYPYIRLKSGQSSSIFGGEGAYLIIKGTIISHDEEKTPFPMANGADNNDLKRAPDYKFNDLFFNWARLKWGNMYWDGLGWTTTPSDFKLWFLQLDGGKTRVRDYFDKEFDVIDTASADFGCSEKGYYIPAPTDGNLTGEADFIIYCPRDWWGRSNHNHWDDANRYNRYYNYVLTLKNLSIKAYISNGFLDDKENDSDTIYTNLIGNGSVSKMDEIKFKVCTYDNKKPTYSSVDYDSNGSSVYVCKTYNKALNSKESGSISSFDRKSGLVQEEHYIFKLVTLYENPMVKLECNLHNDSHKIYGTYTDKTVSGRTFIIDELTTDYKYNLTTLKLIQKA